MRVILVGRVSAERPGHPHVKPLGESAGGLLEEGLALLAGQHVNGHPNRGERLGSASVSKCPASLVAPMINNTGGPPPRTS
jgi:hypothetical protein